MMKDEESPETNPFLKPHRAARGQAETPRLGKGQEAMSNWGKRIKVPPEHLEYAAAYRSGYAEAEHRKLPRERRYFSADGAHDAYRAGFFKRREGERGDAA